MEVAALIVAIYAALVGTASVSWQVFLYRRRRSLRAELRVRPAIVGAGPSGATQVIAALVVNQSEFAITWSGFGFHPQAPGGDHLVPGWRTWVSSKLPLRVDPNDSQELFIDRACMEAAGLDFSKPVRAWASLKHWPSIDSGEAHL